MPLIVYFLAAFISLVVLIAQVRVLAIDATLKEMLKELRELRLIVESRAKGQRE